MKAHTHVSKPFFFVQAIFALRVAQFRQKLRTAHLAKNPHIRERDNTAAWRARFNIASHILSDTTHTYRHIETI